MTHPNVFDMFLLLAAGIGALYLDFLFFKRRKIYDWYYMIGFTVLLVAGLLLIVLGYEILGTPFVLTVSSLIPLGISIGLAEQFYPGIKKPFKWFLLVGIVLIATASYFDLALLRKIVVPLFHSVAGMMIFLGPIFAKGAPKGFYWVGVGGLLIGIGGIALAFLTIGKPLLGLFTADFVFNILSLILALMAGSYLMGFRKDLLEKPIQPS